MERQDALRIVIQKLSVDSIESDFLQERCSVFLSPFLECTGFVNGDADGPELDNAGGYAKRRSRLALRTSTQVLSKTACPTMVAVEHRCVEEGFDGLDKCNQKKEGLTCSFSREQFVLELPRAPSLPPQTQTETPVSDAGKQMRQQQDAVLRIVVCEYRGDEMQKTVRFRVRAVADLKLQSLRRHHLVRQFRAFLSKERLSLRQAFALLLRGAEAEDADRGLLTEMQLCDAMKRLNGPLTAPDLSHLFACMDLNQDSYIHLAEFEASLRATHIFALPLHPAHEGTVEKMVAGQVLVEVEAIDNVLDEPWAGGYGACPALSSALSRTASLHFVLPPPLLGDSETKKEQQSSSNNPGFIPPRPPNCPRPTGALKGARAQSRRAKDVCPPREPASQPEQEISDCGSVCSRSSVGSLARRREQEEQMWREEALLEQQRLQLAERVREQEQLRRIQSQLSANQVAGAPPGKPTMQHVVDVGIATEDGSEGGSRGWELLEEEQDEGEEDDKDDKDMSAVDDDGRVAQMPLECNVQTQAVDASPLKAYASAKATLPRCCCLLCADDDDVSKSEDWAGEGAEIDCSGYAGEQVEEELVLRKQCVWRSEHGVHASSRSGEELYEYDSSFRCVLLGCVTGQLRPTVKTAKAVAYCDTYTRMHMHTCMHTSYIHTHMHTGILERSLVVDHDVLVPMSAFARRRGAGDAETRGPPAEWTPPGLVWEQGGRFQLGDVVRLTVLDSLALFTLCDVVYPDTTR